MIMCWSVRIPRSCRGRWAARCAAAISFAWASVAAAEATPVEDVLASRAFLEGCLGSGSGPILIVGDSLYEQQQAHIVARMREAGVVGPIERRTVERWDTSEVCDTPLYAWDKWWKHGEPPRALVFLALRRGAQDRVSSVELVIRRVDTCDSYVVRRGAWPDVCRVGRPARVVAPPDVPNVPRPRPVRRDEGAGAPIGLLAASAALMGVTIGLRIVGVESREVLAGSFATAASLASSSLAIGAGAFLGVERRSSRRQLAARGTAGAMFLLTGIMTIVAVRYNNELDHPGEVMLHGLGEAASAAGAGLVSSTIAGVRLRPALRASFGGFSLALQF